VSTGTRAFSAVAICALMSGCSWAFMTKPPEAVPAPNYPMDCTTSRAAPVLDTICVGYFIANGIYLAALQDCASASFGQSCVSSSTKTGGVLLSTGLGLLCGFSAASGYGYAARCEEKKNLNALCITGDQQSCRQLRPGWAPPPAGASGPSTGSDPGYGCAKETDCKGDRICVSGVCVSPANAVPPAAPVPPSKPPGPAVPQRKVPQCERDADCEEGICFDGLCRR
jgi:hypothetical protein